MQGKVAAAAASLALIVGSILPTTAMASTSGIARDANAVTTLTPNPWFANGPFEGWGTSLAWLANATGSYGEPGSIKHSSGNAQADAKALQYGKDLREQFYQSIFGRDGLDLNMARYNVGGGNASDVAYGYPFMRQGAAVPGYWAEDPDGSLNLYGGTSTKQADKNALDTAYSANSDDSYVWGTRSQNSQAAKNVQAQEWWLKRGAQNGDITDVEAFANSAPWFMTESGYATGGQNSSAENLKDPQKFGQYLAKVVQHLNTLQAENGNKVKVNTVEPLNESETGYWGTPSDMASAHATGNSEDAKLIQRYWERYYRGAGKDQSKTPYSTAVKKPQEGMHVDNGTAQTALLALHEALAADGQNNVKVSATDATDSGQFVDSYNNYPQNVRDAIGQYNTHSYGTNRQRVARDIAQSDSKRISMSEVDGSWQNGGFNPYGFDNGLGMAGKINSDIYALQSDDFTFWQVVEDLYNMSTADTDINGNAANPKGENTNWGTVLIDFDCNVAGTDGKLYSERDVDNNQGRTNGIKPCSVVVNSKYNAVRAYTKFIHRGDRIIANNSTANNMTATSADGKTQTVIHRNNSSKDEKLVIDLSKYGDIAANASGKLFLTTAPAAKDDKYAATLDYMNQYSNIEQNSDAVSIDAKAKTATVTIPAKSIASIELNGVTGVAKNVGLNNGQSYQLIGQGSNRNLQAAQDGSLTIEDAANDATSAKSQIFTFNEVAADPARPTLHRYVISSADGAKILMQDGKFAAGNVASAKTDKHAIWTLNTEDGEHYSLVNTAAQQALEVGGQKTAAGSAVGTYISNGGTNQAWSIRDVVATGIKPVKVQTPIGTVPTMPSSVTPYYTWGTGQPATATWNTSSLAQQVKTPGTYAVNGHATDIYGNTMAAQAKVYVGKFSVSDPASITVATGSTLAQVKAAAPATANAHVGSSPEFASAAQWQWGDLNDSDFARAGKKQVPGTLDDGAHGTIPASLTIYVTNPKNTNGENLAAAFCSSAAASSTENSHSVAYTCDGKTDDNSWSNWSSSPTDTNPWLSYTFDHAHALNSLEFVSYGEATPKSFTVQYKNGSGDWTDSGITAQTGENLRGDVTTVDISSLPATSGIRLNLTYRDDANYYAKVSEVRIFEKQVVASPSNDATLGDLRLDGKQIEGFNPAKTSYDVKLPYGAESNPVLQAFAADGAAKLSVKWEQPSTQRSATGTLDDDPAIGGKATITTQSADGTTTQNTVVNFIPTALLTGLRVTPPTKTQYAIGDAFDTTGMTVTAVYTGIERSEQTTPIALNDPELSISGFESASAGDKTVTVSYRGVSSTFTVHVMANNNAGTPGQSGQPGQPGQKPNGNAANKPQLSETGSSIVAPVAIALTSLAAAGLLLALRRRRV
ncbi:bacterial Ig-like domain-containing protein [Bifidobacterium sp. ESL0769]|uniref:bacterial Ig-like domain-containing protein n=1 Tax=Bifidobacterium sp. ESL0769 TaxID=2983229 RepID=UPI0023F782C7|nr:bacterial Ig-like domain-containing protein [Bifidobacterium sp. ESL0769]WEV67306.1 bacterial Ig-like domain-containing protein [Bifidobacterium sp. ESL0769]